MSGQAITLRVRSAERVSEDVIQIELESMAGLDLPAWQPGAHVEIALPSGLVRHYSLCGDVDDHKTYRIAVLRETAGRGGSAELHEIAAPGLALPVRAPRNNFELHEAPAYLFLGGGIGITPLIPMIQRAERDGLPWTLVYGGRTHDSMAYRRELQERYPEHVRIFADDAEGRPDFRALLSHATPGTLVYACGPGPMLDYLAVLTSDHDWPIVLQTERFSVAEVETAGQPFDVELARSGTTLHIEQDETILQVMQAKGLNPPFSCENGYCGTCEALVLEGQPQHRDTYLSDEEKDDSFSMMICVSRSVSERLVLDL